METERIGMVPINNFLIIFKNHKHIKFILSKISIKMVYPNRLSLGAQEGKNIQYLS